MNIPTPLIFAFVVVLLAISACDDIGSTEYLSEDEELGPFEKYMTATNMLGRDTIASQFRFHKTNIYFINGDMVADSTYRQSADAGEIEFVYTGRIEMEKTDTIYHQADGSAYYTTNTAHTYTGLTGEYIDRHWFEPNYVDLSMNKYQNLFLSVGTTHSGVMQATVFDIDTGEAIMRYFEDEYDGRYSVGRYIDHPESLGQARAVIVVGDSIAYRDFDLSSYANMKSE